MNIEEQKKMSTAFKVLYIIDLIMVSLWALFALCNFEPAHIMMFPFIVARITSVFSLQKRERKSIILILMFLLGVALSPLFYHYACDNVVMRPFARMYDYIVMCFTGQSTLLEGAWHYLGNHGDYVPDPGTGWKIFTALYLIWLVFEPLGIYIYLMLRKRLCVSKWNRNTVTPQFL